MTLNLKGLNCPLPVIRSIRAVKLLLAGDILQVLVTDRGGDGFRGILLGNTINITPEIRIQGSKVLLDVKSASCVLDGLFDLETIAHNSGISKQACHVCFCILGNTFAIEGVERLSVVLAFLQDR